MNDPNAHSSRATVALQKLIERDPAFGSLSLWCQHRDAEPEDGWALKQTGAGDYDVVPTRAEIAPAYTDGRTIYYGAEFAKWTLDEQVAVCAHEILHIAFRHIPRAHKLAERYGPRYSNRLFNIAADGLINESLRQVRYDLPKPHVSLGKILNLLASQDSAEEALAKLDVESLYFQLLEFLESDKSNRQKLIELANYTPNDVFRGNPLGTDEALASAEWQQRLQRALLTGSTYGRGLGTIMTKLADIPNTSTPWEVILRRMVTKAVTYKPQYSFGAPTRRWLALDAEARSKNHPEIAYEAGIQNTPTKRGRVVVCVDASGSISKQVLMQFAGEILSISKRTGAEIVLIIFDHGIQLVKKLTKHNLRDELKTLQFKSGGGTSFIEPVNEALEHDPSIIVILTDLMGTFGQKPNRIPVIWASCLTNSARPPFGTLINLTK